MNVTLNRLLKDFDVHLASGSPRRKAILNQIGLLNFSVTPSTFEENLDKAQFAHPKDYVLATARGKNEEVMKNLREKDPTKKIFVISADTVVVADGRILEKPATHEHAEEMLTRLNAIKRHEVYTGVILSKYDGEVLKSHEFHEGSVVEFGDISHELIKDYAFSMEPLDKAGGYGIQGVGASLIKKVDGCYFNVMGFPVYSFCQEVMRWLLNE